LSSLSQGVVDSEQMVAIQRTLRRLERFWSHPAAMSASTNLSVSDFGRVFAGAGAAPKAPATVLRH